MRGDRVFLRVVYTSLKRLCACAVPPTSTDTELVWYVRIGRVRARCMFTAHGARHLICVARAHFERLRSIVKSAGKIRILFRENTDRIFMRLEALLCVLAI